MQTTTRNDLLDALRGVAIFGILLVNFRGGMGYRIPELDTVVALLLDVFVLNSFYPLFAFLFGVGFAIQLRRARPGRGIMWFYVRRMLSLFVIGCAHAILVWSGDVLTDYAVIGVMLAVFHRVSQRGVLVACVFFVGLHLGQQRVSAWLPSADRTPEEHRSAQLARAGWNEELSAAHDRRVRPEGRFTADVAIRWLYFTERVSSYFQWRILVRRDLLALCLFGFYVGRRRWLEQAPRVAWPHAAGAGVVAVLAGCALAYNRLISGGQPGVGRIAWMTENYGLTAAYVLGVIACAQTVWGARVLHVFVPVGRMALTNYLMQSLVMTCVLSSWGANMSAPPAFLFVTMNVAFFFLVQYQFSAWWLERWRWGPVEWLWRVMTYGQLIPMTGQGSGDPAADMRYAEGHLVKRPWSSSPARARAAAPIRESGDPRTA